MPSKGNIYVGIAVTKDNKFLRYHFSEKGRESFLNYLRKRKDCKYVNIYYRTLFKERIYL